MKRDIPYLRSRPRRGRWAHYYRRGDKEISLEVHGLHPTDPRVWAAYCAEHARWEAAPPDTPKPKAQTFAWAVDLFKASAAWAALKPSTRQNREAILRRYVKGQGDRPLSTIAAADIETALTAKGGNAAVNELKALKPVFAYAKSLRIIDTDPAAGLKMERPESDGFPTAGADDLAKFKDRWPVGTRERLTLDLGIYTGAARADLARLGRHNLRDGILSYARVKTGVTANVPVTPELRAVIARTADIAPAFILQDNGKPYKAASLGNQFGDAAREAGWPKGMSIHALRKAFCVYWAERGATTHQIAAMAGHMSLSEVERYTRAADRLRMVKSLVEGS